MVRLALVLSLIFPIGTWAQALEPQSTSGKLVEVRAGINSTLLKVQLGDGDTCEFSITPSLEWLPDGREGEYRRLVSSLPGTDWPDYGDLHSRVRVWALGDRFLKYEVLERPPVLWGVIVASETDRSHAFDLQRRVEARGFSSGLIESSRYPRLRPGYHVVLAGAFPTQEAASHCLIAARKKGWKDAYLKRLR